MITSSVSRQQAVWWSVADVAMTLSKTVADPMLIATWTRLLIQNAADINAMAVHAHLVGVTRCSVRYVAWIGKYEWVSVSERCTGAQRAAAVIEIQTICIHDLHGNLYLREITEGDVAM